jgi:NAD(P)-dependent dehydrogenase (short-subunit alcohol dehydrogenase family)
MDTLKLFDLKGSVALVTGSSTGLGYQMAEGLAEVGCNVVISSRRYKKCLEISKEFVSRYKIDSIAIQADVHNEEDIIKMVDEIISHYGKIDILVNNVGGAYIKNSIETTMEEWQQQISLNLSSVFICCREAGKHMIKKRYGKIINIASVYGSRGRDWRYYVKPEDTNESLSYCASKGGVINLTKDLAVNWAKYNITVNSISPGAFHTEATKKFCDEYTINKLSERNPMGRWGEEDDLKGAIVFLASNASKYVTGHNLVVDGGWSAWC